MVVKCELHFIDNPLGIYYAGQTVKGRVDLEMDRPKNIRGVCLHVNGYARSSWSESGSPTTLSLRTDVNKKTYTAEEEYFSYKIYLGTPPQDEGFILPSGLHSYDFSVDLPQDLPTSFEGMFGCIRYTIKAILERPWKFDLKYRLIFTVLKQSDLNYDTPDLRLPVKIEQTKYFYWWPCKSGPLQMTITLPITGFVPGQMIPIAIELDNESSVNIDKIDFKLQKIIKYTSTQPSQRSKVERKMVVSKESGGVPAKERKQLHHNLLIPSIPPSTSTLCSIIQIKYALEIKIVVPSIHKTDKLKIPITIGTVPLRPENILGMHSLFPPGDEAASFVNLTPPIGTAERIELRPIVIETQPPPLPSQPPRYSDINPLASVEEFVNFPTPPSYEESVYGIVQVESVDQDEEMNSVQMRAYVPRYPVYSFYSPATTVPTKEGSSHDEGEPTTTRL